MTTTSVGPGTADAIRVVVEDAFGPGYWDGFQAYMTEDLPWHEWRFGGQLGFGGKIHMNKTQGVWVSGYPEDEAGFEDKIRDVNRTLAGLL